MNQIQSRGIIVIAALALIGMTGCKSSGMAVTERGQLMKINIEVPTDLSDNETRELLVSVSNRGVNKLDDVLFEVEIPNELIILSQVPGDGISMTESRTSGGARLFLYKAGNIEVATESVVRFHVRASFGALQRTGDIKVTAWTEDVPSGRLVESKFIKLRS